MSDFVESEFESEWSDEILDEESDDDFSECESCA
jgi:hypothetical protein